jgi:hypothetical protein
MNQQFNTTPGGDVASVLERQKQEEAALLSEAARITKQAQMLQKDIYKDASPHPLFVTCIIVLILIMVWVLYVMFVKPVATGEWLDAKNDQVWFIRHNPLTDSMTIKILSRDGKLIAKMRGYIKNAVFKTHDALGIWDFNNVIVFVGGGGLQRVQ